MKRFYITLHGFGKYEIEKAAGKNMQFTELITKQAHSPGFILHVFLGAKEKSHFPSEMKDPHINLGTVNHQLYASRETHFSFEPHPIIHIPHRCRLYVQLTPRIPIRECESKLQCMIY
jgi:hypothetical protein